MGATRIIPVNTERRAREKRYAGQMSANSANQSATATANILRKKYAPTVSSRPMCATAAAK